MRISVASTTSEFSVISGQNCLSPSVVTPGRVRMSARCTEPLTGVDWMNGKFMNDLFSNEEKRYVQYSVLYNDIHDTIDQVFLLAAEDMMNPNYGFPDDAGYSAERMAKCNDYAKKKGCARYQGKGMYWLRSTGSSIKNAMNIGTSGYIYHLMEESVTSKAAGIRPAVRVRLDILNKVNVY